MYAKNMEKHAKREPKLEPKSVQNLKKSENGGPNIYAKKVMRFWKRPGINLDPPGVDFGAAGGFGAGFDPT